MIDRGGMALPCVQFLDRWSRARGPLLPRRFSGLAVIIASTTSLPNCLMRSVSIGPGVTQLTRISVSQTSRDKAFVNAITPALAAEYAARLGNPSLPASEPILTIRPRPAASEEGPAESPEGYVAIRWNRIARRVDNCRDIRHCSQDCRSGGCDQRPARGPWRPDRAWLHRPPMNAPRQGRQDRYPKSKLARQSARIALRRPCHSPRAASYEGRLASEIIRDGHAFLRLDTNSAEGKFI